MDVVYGRRRRQRRCERGICTSLGGVTIRSQDPTTVGIRQCAPARVPCPVSPLSQPASQCLSAYPPRLRPPFSFPFFLPSSSPPRSSQSATVPAQMVSNAPINGVKLSREYFLPIVLPLLPGPAHPYMVYPPSSFRHLPLVFFSPHLATSPTAHQWNQILTSS